jgi:hypothetical protein
VGTGVLARSGRRSTPNSHEDFEMARFQASRFKSFLSVIPRNSSPEELAFQVRAILDNL